MGKMLRIEDSGMKSTRGSREKDEEGFQKSRLIDIVVCSYSD